MVVQFEQLQTHQIHFSLKKDLRASSLLLLHKELEEFRLLKLSKRFQFVPDC